MPKTILFALLFCLLGVAVGGFLLQVDSGMRPYELSVICVLTQILCWLGFIGTKLEKA